MTLKPGDWYTVKDAHGREMETYLLLEYIGPAGKHYHKWLVRQSGLFGEEITLLLPYGAAA
jgi:hypothetical protein